MAIVYVIKSHLADDVYKIGFTNRTIPERWRSQEARRRIAVVIEPGGSRLECELLRRFGTLKNRKYFNGEFVQLLESDFDYLLSLPGAKRYEEDWARARNISAVRPTVICQRCKFSWHPRVDTLPRSCPNCKQYKYIRKV
jgi:hypothetical protein